MYAVRLWWEMPWCLSRASPSETRSDAIGRPPSVYAKTTKYSDVLINGHPDLLLREKATGYLWLLQATATGFAPRRYLGDGLGAYDLAD